MPKTTDYEDEPTHVETPLPTRYDPETRQYHFREEPTGRRGKDRAVSPQRSAVTPGARSRGAAH